MSDLKIERATDAATMDDVREALDAALHAQFPGGMLKRTWDGDVLRLSGPGAEGTITLADGKLLGEASLKPPASMMKPLIVQKITAALDKVSGAG